jgi:hypothetical protein
MHKINWYQIFQSDYYIQLTAALKYFKAIHHLLSCKILSQFKLEMHICVIPHKIIILLYIFDLAKTFCYSYRPVPFERYADGTPQTLFL